jgi:hypothetical protein
MIDVNELRYQIAYRRSIIAYWQSFEDDYSVSQNVRDYASDQIDILQAEVTTLERTQLTEITIYGWIVNQADRSTTPDTPVEVYFYYSGEVNFQDIHKFFESYNRKIVRIDSEERVGVRKVTLDRVPLNAEIVNNVNNKLLEVMESIRYEGRDYSAERRKGWKKKKVAARKKKRLDEYTEL